MIDVLIACVFDMNVADAALIWSQVKYSLDPAHMRPGEARLFTKYLSQQSLHIDVWDGDSLLLIGSCHVELKVYLLSFLYRNLYIYCPIF